jgi:hypothetical protein
LWLWNDVKLVDIEFKRHDPHKIVENHLAQFNMKIYVHENSPYDEIFRGFKSYEEVQDRFQTLPPDQQAWFYQFSKAQAKQSTKDTTRRVDSHSPFLGSQSTGSEPEHSGKNKVEETPKSSKVLTQKLEASLSSQVGPQAKAQSKLS